MKAEGATRVDTKHNLWERLFNWGGLLAIHLGALVAFVFYRPRLVDVLICVAFYWARMFAITAGYHRYFSHRAYKTGRVFQFLLGLLGTTSTQKGPLWWAAIHRRHHRESDKPTDVHSPVQHGFFHSHIGWVLASDHEEYDPSEVKDLWKFPELRWLDRFHVVPVLAVIALAAVFGGARGVLWWYCASTAVLMHCTFFINSMAHVWGHRRFDTTDDSRNNFWLALITMGEGWHNNPHRFMQTANQGFYWWQVDASYYLLRALAFVGVTWDLKKPPARILEEGLRGKPAPYVRIDEVVERAGQKARAAAAEVVAGLAHPADAE
ncbi:MAG: acyl-CoA desaturase [Myxococcales bacterium]|nr:acyl-CoA desaturase [Myxococcales bacterium]